MTYYAVFNGKPVERVAHTDASVRIEHNGVQYEVQLPHRGGDIGYDIACEALLWHLEDESERDSRLAFAAAQRVAHKMVDDIYYAIMSGLRKVEETYSVVTQVMHQGVIYSAVGVSEDDVREALFQAQIAIILRHLNNTLTPETKHAICQEAGAVIADLIEQRTVVSVAQQEE